MKLPGANFSDGTKYSGTDSTSSRSSSRKRKVNISAREIYVVSTSSHDVSKCAVSFRGKPREKLPMFDTRSILGDGAESGFKIREPLYFCFSSFDRTNPQIF